MSRKEIQEQRIRTYFIDATREILKSEGLKGLNVRAVSERAGYSYATLYNYFKDIKDLVFICVRGFQEECEQYIESQTATLVSGKAKIKAIYKAYISFFVQYPGIFELFFLEQMNSIGGKQPTSELIYTFPDRLCEKEFLYCEENQILTRSETDILKYDLKLAITGLLLFYLHRQQPTSFKAFDETVDSILHRHLPD